MAIACILTAQQTPVLSNSSVMSVRQKFSCS